MNTTAVSAAPQKIPALPAAIPARMERLIGVAVVLALMLGFGYASYVAKLAWGMDITRPFSVSGVLGASGLLVSLLVARGYMARWGSSWSGYGLNRSLSPLRVLVYALLAVIAIFAAFTWVIGPAVAAIAPHRPDLSHVMNIRGNLFGLVTSVMLVWITAAFMEEFLFRGFLLNETAAALGNGRLAWGISILAIGAMFGIGHLYQGLGGALMTGAVGVLFGVLYLVMKRNLWPLIIAHGIIDTLTLTQIYLLPPPT